MTSKDVAVFFEKLSHMGRLVTEETQTLKKNVNRPAERCFAGGTSALVHQLKSTLSFLETHVKALHGLTFGASFDQINECCADAFSHTEELIERVETQLAQYGYIRGDRQKLYKSVPPPEQCGRVQNGTVMSDATCVGGESLDGPLQTDGFENPVDKLSMEHDTIIGGSSTTNRAEDASHPAGIFTTTSPMSSPLGGKGDMSDLGMKTPTLEDFGLSKYYSTQVATPPPKFDVDSHLDTENSFQDASVALAKTSPDVQERILSSSSGFNTAPENRRLSAFQPRGTLCESPMPVCDSAVVSKPSKQDSSSSVPMIQLFCAEEYNSLSLHLQTLFPFESLNETVERLNTFTAGRDPQDCALTQQELETALQIPEGKSKALLLILMKAQRFGAQMQGGQRVYYVA